MNRLTTAFQLSETQRLLLYLTKKMGVIGIRSVLCLCLGVISWLLFDNLNPAFFWVAIVMMMGSMSIHTVLHQKNKARTWAKQACRFAFFLSFPMLFVFAGNRLSNWSVTEYSGTQVANDEGVISVQGVIASEEYLMLKDLQKDGFKDLKKSKTGFKALLGKHLAKAKQMDKATRTLLIILGAILLLVIILFIAILVAISESADSCLGNDNNNGCI